MKNDNEISYPGPVWIEETGIAPATGIIRASPEMTRRVIVASVLGNAFEWFEFVIFGLFLGVISPQFFPAGDEMVSLLFSLGTFGAAFATRPLGGLVLGAYGDRVGRKKALLLAIGLMTLSTGMIGLLPNYQAIGIAAPILMLLARLTQGFSVGGEFSGATTMLLEFAPPHRRGFYASFQMCSQSLAFSLAALVVYFLNVNLSTEQLNAWGWRLPFLVIIPIGAIGWLIRSRLDESPEFLHYIKSRSVVIKTPIRELLKRYRRELLSNFCLMVTATASVYVFVFYLPIFARIQLGLSIEDVNLSTFAGTFFILILIPFAGHLSDRYSRKAVLLPAIAIYGVVAYFMFIGLIAAPSFSRLLVAQTSIFICMGFVWGALPVVVTESFPVGVRSSGVSLSQNLAVLIFGGSAPFINTWLVNVTGNNAAPIYYIEFSVVVGLIGVMTISGVRRR